VGNHIQIQSFRGFCDIIVQNYSVNIREFGLFPLHHKIDHIFQSIAILFSIRNTEQFFDFY
jgi:hypothetical protein